MINAKIVWDNTVPFIKKDVSSIAFSTWFDVLVPAFLTNDTLFLEAPSELIVNLLNNMYINNINSALLLAGYSGIKVSINVKAKVKNINSVRNNSGFSSDFFPPRDDEDDSIRNRDNNFSYNQKNKKSSYRKASDNTGFVSERNPYNSHNDIGSVYGHTFKADSHFSKTSEETSDKLVNMDGSAYEGSSPYFSSGLEVKLPVTEGVQTNSPASASPSPSADSFYTNNSNLDDKFTFDRFVVGSSSEFAYAASLAVSESPGTKYNPLLVYGSTGLGKTHLMQSIGNAIISSHPSWNVLYITSEKFTNDFVESIHRKSNIKFREKYRSLDVLLIDDIQFFANKERLQEEFFHTFNDLKNNGKQIVLTSDRPPKDIYPLEERLRTRIEGGLMADIKPPDYETRLAILKKKLSLSGQNLNLPYEVIDLIASQIKSNIRELEGAVKKIMAYHEISHNDIDLSVANNILSDYFSTVKNQHIDANTVIKAVEKYFQLNESAIVSSKRDRKYSYPRQIAMYICRELTDLSLPQIGSQFGGRDHTTVIHSINKIKNEIESNLSALNLINDIIEKIKTYA